MTRQQGRTSQGRNNTIDRRAKRPGAYVDGNTVRKLNTVPSRMPVPGETREQERRKKADRQTRANRERAMRMNPAYLLFLTMAVALSVGVCGLYIKFQTEVSSRRNHVAALESQILDLRTDNDAALNRIETSVNLEEIKDTAMNSLGMVYPSKDQIVYFTVNIDDYMNQYRDIPEK